MGDLKKEIESKLKPCPFCGGSPAFAGTGFPVCQSCGSSSPNWNCRAEGLLIARAEKAEAELAEADRVLAIHKRDYEAHFKAHQEELAEAAMLISQYTRQKKQRRRSKRAM